MEGLAIVVLVLVGPVVYLIHRAVSTGRERAWQQAARELGLGFEVRGLFATSRICGSIGRLAVDVRVVSRGKQGSDTVFRIDGLGAIPRSLAVTREGLGASLAKLFGGQDIQSGDSTLDPRVRIEGDEVTAIALLEDETRRLLLDLVVGEGVEVRDGSIELTVRGYVGMVERLTATVRSLVALGERLVPGGRSYPELLLGNATGSRERRVRLRALRLLCERFPRSPHTAEACREALRDPDPEVRLEGALRAGATGLGTARELARTQAAPVPVRVLAIEHLVARDAATEVVALLEGLLDVAEEGVRAAAVRGLGRRRHAPLLARLREMAPGSSPGLAVAAAEALGSLRDPAAEETLLGLLAREDDGVRRAAARALGRVGTAAAVEALLAFTRGRAASEALRKEARGAVRAIQGRLRGAEAGQLSLAETGLDGGALSLAGEAGGLTVAGPDEERPADEAPPEGPRPRVSG